ncbi:hypothetical protein ACFFLM_24930 [Deinococcus oregonensis]|uniref:Uncharacterized protein n=1 Tax=Deinococcus oregonensis TaxID=1805970 RepID=A0ABV6B896_9DEIO
MINEGAALDELLDSLVDTGHPKALIPSSVQEWALASAAEEWADQQGLMQTYDARPGKELTLKSASTLWPRAFDPMNMKLVGQGRVFHQRFLHFGNSTVEGEIIDCPCLTQSGGPDPLGGGFQELRLRGVLSVQSSPESWLAAGLAISLKGRAGTISWSERGCLIEVEHE